MGVNSDESQRNTFRQFLIDLSLEDRIIEVEVPTKASRAEKTPIAIDPSNSSAFANEIFKMVRPGNGKKSLERKKLPISEARPLLEEMEADRLMEEVDVIKEAISAVEDSGIVFIDEIDKLINTGDYRGADASSEGVQRDLLPLIEGSTISTKHGNVNTDFILFIASGAFHQAKPSDLLAELQGRLPIRVSLKGLTEDDLFRILTEPVTNLIQQQVELLKSENVHLTFTTSALREIARVAFQVSEIEISRLLEMIIVLWVSFCLSFSLFFISGESIGGKYWCSSSSYGDRENCRRNFFRCFGTRWRNY